ncbi:MAG: hypothetical protein IT454_04305 [Planctomycetes bacterium]|nr:hypothetical protein [Planctomycetota bacterium]
MEPQYDPSKLTLSLDQIEGRARPARIAATPIARRCDNVRAAPLGTLKAGDLGMLIGQHIALDIVVPRAIELLEETPLITGDDFPGDLLGSVLRIEQEFWLRHPRWHGRVAAIADRVASAPEEIAAELQEFPRTLTA